MRLRTVALTCLTVAVVGAAPQLVANGAGSAPPTGRVAVDQSYPVPASGRYTVRGHGYGHGRGMSQHGAQGAALDGLDHEEILAFYYPGTRLATAKGRIKVLISSDTTSDVIVAAAPGLLVRDLGTGTTYPVPTNVGATRWRITIGTGNSNVVDYLAGSTWRRWRPGGQAALDGEGEFQARGPLTLFTSSGDATYRGRLRAAKPTPTSTVRDTVNVLSLNNYVQGVVPYEMPALWEPEAVQSQSVAARTYGTYHRTRNADRYYQICDTTACQVYRGVDGEHPASNDAVRATSRQVMTYDGAPAFTEFSASSGGWTVASSIPYQQAKPDPYDDWSGNSNHDWSVGLTAAAIQRAYPSLGNLRRIRVTARDGNGQWQGRVLNLSLVGSRNTVRVSGDTFRFRFGLRSTWFSF